MRLVTLQASDHPSAGIIVGDQVLDLSTCVKTIPDAQHIPGSVRGILEGGANTLALLASVRDQANGASDSLREQLVEQGALSPLAQTRLRAPIPDARLILSCGLNYRRHLREMGGSIPERPLAFSKSVQAIIGPGESIVLPRQYPDMVDWEIEFCAVIGRPCHNVSREDAPNYIAGYTLINDVSARNWVAPFGAMQGMTAIAGWESNLLGKHFPTFCPMGPWLVTADELPNPNAINIELAVNGQIMQSACTDDLVFDIPTLISYYSQYYAFQPGDVITTGSPAGVGFAQNPPVFLKDGDVVKLSADGLGTMITPVSGRT